MFGGIKNTSINHCLRIVPIRSFSGAYFPAFGLNTDRISLYSVQMRENTDQENSGYGRISPIPCHLSLSIPPENRILEVS